VARIESSRVEQEAAIALTEISTSSSSCRGAGFHSASDSFGENARDSKSAQSK
jgi:hypothetical protein